MDDLHRQCRGQVFRLAAAYHFKLCRAILVGLRRQLDKDGVCRQNEGGVTDGSWESDAGCRVGFYRLQMGELAVLNIKVADDVQYWDDLMGHQFDP